MDQETFFKMTKEERFEFIAKFNGMTVEEQQTRIKGMDAKERMAALRETVEAFEQEYGFNPVSKKDRLLIRAVMVGMVGLFLLVVLVLFLTGVLPGESSK